VSRSPQRDNVEPIAHELAGRLRFTRARLLEAAARVAPDKRALRPADGEWSVIEVLAHLIDADYHWLAQAEALRDVPDHLFVGFDDELWKAEHANVRETPVESILEALAQSHAAVIEALLQMTAAGLLRPGRHPRCALLRPRRLLALPFPRP